jgi:hypothetical protein
VNSDCCFGVFIFYADPTIKVLFTPDTEILQCLGVASVPPVLAGAPGRTAVQAKNDLVNWLDAMARRACATCLTYDANDVKVDGTYSNLKPHEAAKFQQFMSTNELKAWKTDLLALGISCGRLEVHTGSGRGVSSTSYLQMGPFQS